MGELQKEFLTITAPDTRALTRDLSEAAQKQIPFAAALAVNAVAKQVVSAEVEGLSETFNQPRSFTKGAFTTASEMKRGPGFASLGGMNATSKMPVAIIVAKPIQERYLSPSEQPKERQSLGRGKKIRTPVNIKLGASGDIPKDAIEKLLARPDTFMGVVKGINGIWQRPLRAPQRGTKFSYLNKRGIAKQIGVGKGVESLRLLVAFTRPVPVRTDMHYQQRAQATVDANWSSAFAAGLQRALATAK